MRDICTRSSHASKDYKRLELNINQNKRHKTDRNGQKIKEKLKYSQVTRKPGINIQLPMHCQIFEKYGGGLVDGGTAYSGLQSGTFANISGRSVPTYIASDLLGTLKQYDIW